MADQQELAGIEKLKDMENYSLWIFQITIMFKASGLWNLVNDIDLFKNCKDDSEKRTWTQKDAKAQKLIIQTTEKNCLLHILNCFNSAEMFATLKTIYEKDTKQQKCNLFQEFYNMKLQSSTIMTDVSKLQNLAHRLKTMGETITDEMLISKLLPALPEKYKFFKCAWESTNKDERTLNNLVSRLQSEFNSERCDNDSEQVALNVQGKQNKLLK